MIPSTVKEASGLYTIKSTLYMQPTKADKDSVFRCTVEYSMPEVQIKQKKSDTININLNCEWRREDTLKHKHLSQFHPCAEIIKETTENYSRFCNHACCVRCRSNISNSGVVG